MKPFFVNSEPMKSNAGRLPLRCPACSHVGIFEPLFEDIAFVDKELGQLEVGHRLCPNGYCRAHIFVAFSKGNIFISYPAERIDFDATDIPAAVVECLDEAINCHANQCFTASAMMVRKTLEVLCHAQGANGNNLKDKITALQTKVILPPELFIALNEVRLLGNDAAHIDSQAYEKVSQDEVESAILFAKEVLKGIYQYSNLLNRMQALKKKKVPVS